MMARKDLIVLNDGGCPTFQRGCSSSVIDLTLASNSVARRIQGWRVLDEVTLSDHMYIEFSIDDIKRATKKTKIKGISWNINKLDEQKLRQFMEEQKILESMNWVKKEKSHIIEIKNTVQKIKEACDRCMPRRKRQNVVREPAYWWTEEISATRKRCLEARRKYTRSRGDQGLNEEFNRLREQLKTAIKNSKLRCWRQLLNEVDADPWGKAFQIVMGRLLPKQKIPGLQDSTWVLKIIKDLFPTIKKVTHTYPRNRASRTIYHSRTTKDW